MAHLGAVCLQITKKNQPNCSTHKKAANCLFDAEEALSPPSQTWSPEDFTTTALFKLKFHVHRVI